MKKMILLLSSILYLTSVKADFIEVQGKLLDDVNLGGRINKMIFTPNKAEIKLVNEYVELPSCVNGRYELAQVAPGLFEISDVFECEEWVDETEEVEYCPESFMPVCGEMAPDCENGICGKSLPELRTFSNSCELYKSKAVFIHNGECK
jgi:hypothetical protein